MRRHSVVPAVAVGTLAIVGLAAAPSLAATTHTPTRGSAQSSLSLLNISVANKVLNAVDVFGTTSTVKNALAALNIVPVSVAGKNYGAQTITPASGSKTIAAPSTPGLAGGLASVASPVLTAAASLPASGPLAVLGATSLGSAKILGLPLSLGGSLSQTATTSSQSVGMTGLTLTNFALPSVADLLGALGLDLNALPVSTLNGLINQLDLSSTGLAAANSAITAAQSAASSTIDRLRSATALVTTRTSAVTSATSAVNAATTQLTSALSALTTPILTAAGLGAIPTAAAFQALPTLTQTVLTTALPAIGVANTALDLAQTTLATATAALHTATGLVGALTNLGDLVKSVLDGTPLASIASIKVDAAASAGHKPASEVVGTVSGIKVLGTDVLKSVTGLTSIDLTKLTTTTLNEVQGAANSLTSSLQKVLSTVPGVSGLKLPLPQIKVLDILKSAKTFSNGSQQATASVNALTMSLPAFTVPSALALPSALSLPGISSVTGGILGSALKVTVGSIAENALFYPAGVSSTAQVVKSTPTSTTSSKASLAETGGDPALAAVSVGLLAMGFGLRRKMKLNHQR